MEEFESSVTQTCCICEIMSLGMLCQWSDLLQLGDGCFRGLHRRMNEYPESDTRGYSLFCIVFSLLLPMLRAYLDLALHHAL